MVALASPSLFATFIDHLSSTRRRREGITLIETMAIVTLLAILAGTFLVDFRLEKAKGNAAASGTVLATVGAKFGRYCDDNNNTCAADLATLVAAGTNYLRAVPIDPSTGTNAYIVTVTNNPGAYCFTIVAPGVYDEQALLSYPIADGTKVPPATAKNKQGYLVFDSTSSSVYHVVGAAAAAVAANC